MVFFLHTDIWVLFKFASKERIIEQIYKLTWLTNLRIDYRVRKSKEILGNGSIIKIPMSIDKLSLGLA